MSKSTSSSTAGNDLPAEIVGYKPQILKIKLVPFESWIESRLVELLDGLEDDIVCSFVYNYLEDAQKKAKKEGPLANPSGGLNAPEIYSSLIGFLGAKKARIFVCELFGFLQKAETSDKGVPPEFALKPEEAEREAFGIINDKRKEMELSDRVRREVRNTENYNRREYDGRDYRRSRRHSHSHSPRSRSRSRSRSYRNHYDDRNLNRNRDHDRNRYSRSDRYYEDRHGDDRRPPHDESRDRHDCYRERHYSRDDDRSRDAYDRHDRNGRKDRPSKSHKSPIPSSSPESPSPCWEATTKPAQLFNSAAPNIQESVPSDLELALKARALKSLAEKKSD